MSSRAADLNSRIAALQIEFERYAQLHPWITLAVGSLKDKWGTVRIGALWGAMAPEWGQPGVGPPTNPKLCPVVNHVYALTGKANRLLLQVLEKPNQLPADIQQEIRDCDKKGWHYA